MKGGKRGRHDFPESLREAGGGVCVCMTRTSSPVFG